MRPPPTSLDPPLYIIWLSNRLALSVPDEGYSRNAPCLAHLVPTF